MEDAAMSTFECAKYYSFWPSVIFFGGYLPLTCLIAKYNEFGIKDAVFGRRWMARI
jgi:hypothetical protein